MPNWILGDLFLKDFGVAGSVKTLWETRWKFPCSRGLYPFHDGNIEDFAPIFDKLIENNTNDPYDDHWCASFMPVAEQLVQKADLKAQSDPKAAIELYKRASVVNRIGRFPYVDGTPLKRKAFEAQKKAYMKGAALWDVPMKELDIEHKYAGKGDDGKVPLYVREVPGLGKGDKRPVLLLISGLDGHRPDNTERSDEAIKRGWHIVILDIPGAADCPANRKDPVAPERLFDSVFEWMAKQESYDMKRIVTWGLSAGGYYAIRLAHTHADKLAGAVGHGAGTHHYLAEEWLAHCGHHEYPFDLLKCLIWKYGYKDYGELAANAQKDFSLLDNGILDTKSCRLFLMNGTMDGCMPIEDSMLLFEHGQTAKEARFIPGRAHMGYPEANSFVWPWLEGVVDAVK